MRDLRNGNEQFVLSLFSWYQKHKRDLPWRHTRDPYKIWVSEIILQQTRIDQGTSYYLRFVEQWPDVKSLACASEDALMKTWEGLGYYNRARNMHQTAKYVAGVLDGQFPESYEELLELKGIGPYTAAAIASFAYALSHPVVDGNVYRVVSRIKNLDIDITKSSARRSFEAILRKMMAHSDPAVFNNAIMEFGALQCIPKNPKCNSCFYRENCAANLQNTVDMRPVKSKKIKKKTRYLHYFLQKGGDRQWVRKRDTGDIWAGLYEFPHRETPGKAATLSEILPKATISQDSIQSLCSKKHQLTHQTLHIYFWQISFDKEEMENEGYREMTLKEMEQLSFPRPLRGICKKL